LEVVDFISLSSLDIPTLLMVKVFTLLKSEET